MSSSDITRYERPAVTADCVLFTVIENCDVNAVSDDHLRLQVRLVRRPTSPEKGKWALLGAFVPIEERIEDVMRRAVREKGGYGQRFFAEQLYTFDTPGRDERWRVISVAYLGIIPIWESVTQRADDAYWFYIDQAARTLYQPVLDLSISFDELAFDHADILSVALDRLRAKVTCTDIALEFLHDRFTVSDIRSVMEAIAERPVSNVQRMFSKRIEKVEDADTAAVAGSDQAPQKRPAHRPAVTYRRKSQEDA